VAGSFKRYAALVIPLVTASVVAACGHRGATPPQAPAPAVGVELKAAQPSYPVGTKPQIIITLHNNGSQACALPSVADGSVEVVSVTRDGSAVLGRPGHESLFNGMAAVVAQSLRSVAPGESISVPLDIEISAHRSPVIRTSQQTPVDDGGITSWLIDQTGKYRITARVVAVNGVQRPDLPPRCPLTGTAASAEFQVAR
jgi:hypothetical protein